MIKRCICLLAVSVVLVAAAAAQGPRPAAATLGDINENDKKIKADKDALDRIDQEIGRGGRGGSSQSHSASADDLTLLGITGGVVNRPTGYSDPEARTAAELEGLLPSGVLASNSPAIQRYRAFVEPRYAQMAPLESKLEELGKQLAPLEKQVSVLMERRRQTGDPKLRAALDAQIADLNEQMRPIKEQAQAISEQHNSLEAAIAAQRKILEQQNDEAFQDFLAGKRRDDYSQAAKEELQRR